MCAARAICFCRLKIFSRERYMMLCHTYIRVHTRSEMAYPQHVVSPLPLFTPTLLLLFAKIHQPLPLCAMFVCCLRPLHLYVLLDRLLCVSASTQGSGTFLE